MRIGGVRHGRLPFGTKRELLGEDGMCRKMLSGLQKMLPHLHSRNVFPNGHKIPK